MAKVVHGVILGLAGVSLFIVSIWLLVDTGHPKIRRLHIRGLSRGYSPIIGTAASILLVILGALCCFVSKINLRRTLILVGVFVAIGLTASCFGIAIRDRVDLNHDNALKAIHRVLKDAHIGNYKITISDVEDILTKLKTQLVVMAVIAGLDILVEIVSFITAYKWKEGYP